MTFEICAFNRLALLSLTVALVGAGVHIAPVTDRQARPPQSTLAVRALPFGQPATAWQENVLWTFAKDGFDVPIAISGDPRTALYVTDYFGGSRGSGEVT